MLSGTLNKPVLHFHAHKTLHHSYNVPVHPKKHSSSVKQHCADMHQCCHSSANQKNPLLVANHSCCFVVCNSYTTILKSAPGNSANQKCQEFPLLDQQRTLAATQKHYQVAATSANQSQPVPHEHYSPVLLAVVPSLHYNREKAVAPILYL